MPISARRFLRDISAIRNILVVVLTPILLLPLPLVGDSSETACGYVIILMAVFWVTEAFPIAVTALLPIVLFPMLGVMTAKLTAVQYFNDTSMLFIGGLVVAAAIEEWNIHRRIALGILMLVGSEPMWLMAGLMAPTWFLSMWISNTATTAMMLPIATAILGQLRSARENVEEPVDKGHDNPNMELEMEDITINVNPDRTTKTTLPNGTEKPETETSTDSQQTGDLSDDPQHLHLCTAISLCIAYSANVGGIGSVTGTGPNLVMRSAAEELYIKYGGESPLTFTSWMVFALPTSFIVLILVWGWLQVFFMRCSGCRVKQDKKTSDRVAAVIRKQYESLGPITFAQGVVAFHFALLAVLWISRDLGHIGGWGDIFLAKYVTDSTPACLIALMLFIFPSTIPRVFCCRSDDAKSEKVIPILNWKTAQEKIPWGVFLLLGGGYAMSKGSQESGLSKWLGNSLAGLGGMELWAMNLILCFIVAMATEVTSNTAICMLMMPILSELALSLQVNPLYLMFPAALATSFAFMLPVATPPNAIVFASGYVRVIDMVKTGFILNILAVLVLCLGTETWGNAYFGFHTMPEIFRHNSTAMINTTYPPMCECVNYTTPLL